MTKTCGNNFFKTVLIEVLCINCYNWAVIAYTLITVFFCPYFNGMFINLKLPVRFWYCALAARSSAEVVEGSRETKNDNRAHGGSWEVRQRTARTPFLFPSPPIYSLLSHALNLPPPLPPPPSLKNPREPLRRRESIDCALSGYTRITPAWYQT